MYIFLNTETAVNWQDRTKSKGFTIIELLIVIVVIAILASISFVAYNNIQQKATNVARISAAKNTMILLESYYALNQRYPDRPTERVPADFPDLPDNPVPSPTMRASCLGNGWPQQQGHGVCWNIYLDGEPSASTFRQNSSVNTALQSAGTIPDYPKESAARRVEGSTGRTMDMAGLILAYHSAATSAFPQGYSIAYLLKGADDPLDWGLPGAIKTYIGGVVTRCAVPLRS